MTAQLELPKNLQPPMQNGEVVFEAPWQSRVFSMAVSLSEAKVFHWSEFQASLIQQVGIWEQRQGTRTQVDDYPYFEIFQTALIDLLASKQILPNEELQRRVHEFEQRPHDHDHHH